MADGTTGNDLKSGDTQSIGVAGASGALGVAGSTGDNAPKSDDNSQYAGDIATTGAMGAIGASGTAGDNDFKSDDDSQDTDDIATADAVGESGDGSQDTDEGATAGAMGVSDTLEIDGNTSDNTPKTDDDSQDAVDTDKVGESGTTGVASTSDNDSQDVSNIGTEGDNVLSGESLFHVMEEEVVDINDGSNFEEQFDFNLPTNNVVEAYTESETWESVAVSNYNFAINDINQRNRVVVNSMEKMVADVMAEVFDSDWVDF